MKFTVSLFKFRKVKLPKLKMFLRFSAILLGLVIIFSMLVNSILKTEKGAKLVMSLANNFSKRNKTDFEIQDLAKTYPVFNNENYSLAKETVKVSEVAKKEEVKVTQEIPVFDVKEMDTFSILELLKKPNLKITSTSSYDRVSIYGISILNYSSNKEMDYEKLFNRKITLTKKSDPVLIYSTHTSESYTNSTRYKFNYSGTYRTRNSSYNMLSVASILSNSLKEKRFNVIFDTTPHDYTSYQNAYKNSKKTIQNNLSSNSHLGMAIDVHRDAGSNLSYAPTVNINGKKVAKIMIVIGVGTKGYENKYWYENLSLACKIMRIGESIYPGLFKPMIIRSSKYNQDLCENSFLVEVGATGNTLEEAYYAARCLSNILNKIYT